MDGPMWGLSFEENEKFYMKTLLTILRIPGIFLFDIWWTTKDHQKSSNPIVLGLEDAADTGLHFLIFIMVNIPKFSPLFPVIFNAFSRRCLFSCFQCKNLSEFT